MYKEYRGISKDLLLELTKEELIDLLARVDEYTYGYEGFHPLENMLEGTPEEKYLFYEEVEVTEIHGGGVTMGMFDVALKEAYGQAMADELKNNSGLYRKLFNKK